MVYYVGTRMYRMESHFDLIRAFQESGYFREKIFYKKRKREENNNTSKKAHSFKINLFNLHVYKTQLV